MGDTSYAEKGRPSKQSRKIIDEEESASSSESGFESAAEVLTNDDGAAVSSPAEQIVFSGQILSKEFGSEGSDVDATSPTFQREVNSKNASFNNELIDCHDLT